MLNGLQWEDVDFNELGATLSWSGGTYMFSNLPKYDVAPFGWQYQVKEAEVAGYASFYEGNTITNQKIQSLAITPNSGSWVYDGETHEAGNVQFFAHFDSRIASR